MKYFALLVTLCYCTVIYAGEEKRMLWASINGRTDTGTGVYKNKDNDKVLVSWRKLPTDKEGTAFDIYRQCEGGKKVKVNKKPIKVTNFQDNDADLTVDNTYFLTYSGQKKELDSYTITAGQLAAKLPYTSIPLKSTADINDAVYEANDASVGDLDGDGVYEIVLKRLYKAPKTKKGEPKPETPYHTTLLEAYRLDGTFLWRMKMGPNIKVNNGLSFGVYDFDNDGMCEVAVRTAEGTVFGDGEEIGDMNGDDIIDNRTKAYKYMSRGPEFLSVIEGRTGKELARADYIPRGTSEEWGDNYFKRANSFRLGVAKCDKHTTSIITGRGCYGKIVVEAWDYKNGKLSRRWHFNTDETGNESYAAQGYHSFSTADVDGDGLDEVVYGACTIDHDGKGLNNCGYGHGDALHVGAFDPMRNGLQIWSCFESGTVGAAFRDGMTGETIWKYDSNADVGRCMVADIDPDSPGCEMWWFRGNAHTPDGKDLGYNPGSSNMAIWWSGSLNRQLMDGNAISAPRGEKGRVFTLYRYGVGTNNSSKKNPCFYGDIVGDWREEVILRSNDNTEIRIFSTWFPTAYSFPYLMSDHVYLMSALNQNIGYNQPTHTGFYLGSDLLK